MIKTFQKVLKDKEEGRQDANRRSVKTAILFSGTAYNFEYSINSLFENLVTPNNADVFILTHRANDRRKSPTTVDVATLLPDEEDTPILMCRRKPPTAMSSDDGAAWDEKNKSQFRDNSKPVSDGDVKLIKDTLGSVKAFCFTDDMPDYLEYISQQRLKMMNAYNAHPPHPYYGKISSPNDYAIRSVCDQYNHVKKCYELMCEFELKNNFKYDYVMRARIDFIAPERFDIRSYMTQGDSNLYLCGEVRNQIQEWADEFCWFSNREIASKLFSSLDKMGTITDGGGTFGENHDFRWHPETQFSLLLRELNIPVTPVRIYRVAQYTHGGDGYDYFNYVFRDDTNKPIKPVEEKKNSGPASWGWK